MPFTVTPSDDRYLGRRQAVLATDAGRVTDPYRRGYASITCLSRVRVPGRRCGSSGGSSGAQQAARSAALTARGLTRTFGQGDSAVHAVAGLDLDLAAGSFTAVIGPSGSGKSTLLHLLAGLDQPDGGSVRLGEVELNALDEDALTALRRDRMGFVLQDFSLLPALSVAENIDLPFSLGLDSARRDARWRDHLIGALGLSALLDRRPGQLSGGQQQRVAVVRALAHRPAVVFADEPTGNLDLGTGRRLLGLLRGLAAEQGVTVVMVTHDVAAAALADRVIVLADGTVARDIAVAGSTSAEDLAAIVVAAGGDR
jgi:putative ABC transport system ATP-binding protein